VQSRARFSDAISKLHDYSLVEVQAGSYSLHPCVHDWTLSWLNREFDEELWRLAVHCIAESVKWMDDAEFWVENRRLTQHAYRLEYDRLKTSIDWTRVGLEHLSCIVYLHSQSGMRTALGQVYMQELQRSEEMGGKAYTTLTLKRAINLGHLYLDQGKIEKAERMLIQALQGYKVCGEQNHYRYYATMLTISILSRAR